MHVLQQSLIQIYSCSLTKFVDRELSCALVADADSRLCSSSGLGLGMHYNGPTPLTHFYLILFFARA